MACGDSMRLNEVSEISWGFYPASKLLLQRDISPLDKDLCSHSDEYYKYSPYPDYFLVLIEVSFEIIPLNSH